MPDEYQTSLGIACGQMGEMVLPTDNLVPIVMVLSPESRADTDDLVRVIHEVFALAVGRRYPRVACDCVDHYCAGLPVFAYFTRPLRRTGHWWSTLAIDCVSEQFAPA